jgi:hypothetical protein
MRVRCFQCYTSKYFRQYTAFSYRWSTDDRRNATRVIYAHDETAATISKCIKVPIANQAHFSVVMGSPLFFLDVLNASDKSRQWTPGKVSDTYASSARQVCLLNNSDQRIIDNNREYNIHQTKVPRDRGPFLDSTYGKTERFAAHASLPPSNVSFIGPLGKERGNIEAEGLVKGARNIYDQVAVYGDMVPGTYNRSMGSRLSRAIPADKRDPKKEKPLRGHIAQARFELNPNRILGPNGKYPTPTPAYPDMDSTGLDSNVLDSMGALSIRSQTPTASDAFHPPTIAPTSHVDAAWGSQTSSGSLPIDAGLGSDLNTGTFGQQFEHSLCSHNPMPLSSFPADPGFPTGSGFIDTRLGSDLPTNLVTFTTSPDLNTAALAAQSAHLFDSQNFIPASSFPADPGFPIDTGFGSGLPRDFGTFTTSSDLGTGVFEHPPSQRSKRSRKQRKPGF